MECTRAKTSRHLVIANEPAKNFYKYDGGKKQNFLRTVVKLVKVNGSGCPVEFSDSEYEAIPLTVTLCLESGREVQEQDILDFVVKKPLVIDKASREVEILFRIEKISRRVDGQRFKLRIEPQRGEGMSRFDDIREVYTLPINVLSKRKAAASKISGIPSPKKARAWKRDLIRLENSIEHNLQAVEAEVARLSHAAELYMKSTSVGLYDSMPDSELADLYRLSTDVSTDEVLPSDFVQFPLHPPDLDETQDH